MKIPLSFVAIVVLQAGAVASVTQDLIESLKTELQTMPKEAKTGMDRFKLEQLAALLARPERDDAATETLTTTLEQLTLTGSTDNLRAIAKTLSGELKKELAARDAALSAEIKKTIGDAIKQTLAAKTARELDEPYATVNKLVHGTRLPKPGPLAQQVQQLSQTRELIRSFQDYLTWLAADAPRRSRPYLTVGTDFEFSDYVPRSEVLLRIKELEKLGDATGGDPEITAEQWSNKVKELIAGVKGLDDLPGALKAIDALRASPFGASRVPELEELRALSATYQLLKRGQATTISLPPPAFRSGANAPLVEELRDQVVAYALPRLLALPEGTALRPGETPLTFLQRTLAGAKEKRDWLLVGRVVDVAQRFGLQIGTVASDAQALTLFLAGYNQDRAQQYTQAVTSYLAALKTGSQIIPPEHIGELLALVKKGHPQEYEVAAHAYDEAYLRAQAGGSALAPFRSTGEGGPAPTITVPAPGR